MSAGVSAINTSSFRKIEFLFYGSSSTVYLVKKVGGEDNEQQYVMKELTCISNMEHEKTILNMLTDSPFVSKMHYHFEEKRRGYIILSYCRGGSLEKLLSSDIVLNDESVRFLLAEIILGIESFHRLGIIHRDIKPDNICLDNDGHAVVIDFGLAMILTQEEDKIYSIGGTPGFIAPEVEEIPAPGYNHSADFFSLGVTAYVMVNKEFPRDAHNITPDRIHGMHSRLSPEFKDFVCRLLLKSPNERLGGGGGGTDALKCHPFFKEMNWSELAKKNIKSPFV